MAVVSLLAATISLRSPRPELAQARGRRGRAGKRSDGRGVSVDGEDLAAAGEPEGKGAGAAEEVRDPLRVGERPLGEFRKQRFARFGRLQEAARRQLDQRLRRLARQLWPVAGMVDRQRVSDAVSDPGHGAACRQSSRWRSAHRSNRASAR